jgi:Tfp pilus assembly protein PilO
VSAAGHTATGTNRSYTRKVVGLGLLACAGLSAGSYLLGVRPAIARLADRAAAEEELHARQAAADKAVADLAVARARLAAARRELDALPLRLEPAAAVNRRLNQLAEAAAAAGVTLNEVQPHPPVDGPHYQTVLIRVGGTGGYPACAAFLHAVRDRFPDTSVRLFEAQNPTPDRDRNVAGFRLDLAWHAAPAAK